MNVVGRTGVRWGVLAGGVLAVMLWAAMPVARAHADGPILVTSLDDPSDRGGDCTTNGSPTCTLRAAVAMVSRQGGPAAIQITKSGTIHLDNQLGQIVIAGQMTIQGQGPDKAPTVIDGGVHTISPVLHVGTNNRQPVAVGLSDLTIEHGGGGIVTDKTGVLTLDRVHVKDSLTTGITSLGPLTIHSGSVTDNRGGCVGGIFSSGDLEITAGRSGDPAPEIARNTTNVLCEDDETGGGIEATGPTHISGAWIHDNSAQGAGGGVQLGEGALVGNTHGNEVAITDSTISDNHADVGGGIAIDLPTSHALLVNDTLTGNGATAGGAINDRADKDPSILRFVTIAANSSTRDPSGGIQTVGGTVAVAESLLANNTTKGTDTNCGPGATITEPLIGSAQGHNLDTGTTCGFKPDRGSLSSVTDPKLDAAPAANGGPTPTLALRAGSPAIDAGDPRDTGQTDQRGVPRGSGHTGRAPDIGAFEFVFSDANPGTGTGTQSGGQTATLPAPPNTGTGVASRPVAHPSLLAQVAALFARIFPPRR